MPNYHDTIYRDNYRRTLNRVKKKHAANPYQTTQKNTQTYKINKKCKMHYRGEEMHICQVFTFVMPPISMFIEIN